MVAMTTWKYRKLSYLQQSGTFKNRNFCVLVTVFLATFAFFYYLCFHDVVRRLDYFSFNDSIHNETLLESRSDPKEYTTSRSDPNEYTMSLRTFECFDKGNNYKIAQKGNFWVLYNYVRARKWFECHESVTYTTIGDLSFLDNLVPLVERWQGPVSVALYTPGTDFETALSIVKYLRKCRSPLIAELVSFHIYFEADHRPDSVPKPADATGDQNVDCSEPAPWSDLNSSELYRSKKKLYFPINVGRNIARDAATTHYILASDIELYPSANVIPDFLEMIRQANPALQTDKPKVFVLPPFEVEETANPPDTKQELVKMLAKKSAVHFHRAVCAECHRVPKIKEWIHANINSGMHVFYTAKKRNMWEPFYIGTHDEPYFDERLSWEGRCNKLTQAYTMCLIDYDYHILDNAFLVHRPGIKKFVNDPVRLKALQKTIWQIRHKIRPEIHELYGTNKDCSPTIIFGK